MAITKTIQATVKNRTDTAANWTQKNPVLAEGEIIVVQTSAGETRLKIGDGVKTFTQLPYTDEQIYNNVVTSVNGETGDITLDVSGDGVQPAGKSYLTFSSLSSFTLAVADSTKHWDGTLEYFASNKTWITWDGTTTLSAVENDGEYVLYLRGTGNTVITGNSSNYKWVLTGTDISCVGNIENLLDYVTVQSGAHPTMAESCYYNMFNGCTSLTQAPSLPATTLAIHCYNSMFYGCTSLTQAPALPATTLADYCYRSMFFDCTSLTQAPALPATTLASNCYQNMFNGCTSLTQATALPATTLASNCYFRMFQYCTSLTKVPSLPATTLAESCYSFMFNGCTSLTQAPSLPATTLAESCYEGIFNGCTSLTQVPALPATTLATNCYFRMFYGCTSLTQAPALPATTLADYCYSCMFYGCTRLKLSSTKTGEYTQEYRIPSTGEGTTAANALTSMFASTGGTFTGNPEINTTYYLSSDNMIVRGSELANLNGYVKTMIDAAVDIPTTLPNPNAITFTGAVNAIYDGSTAVSVEIPSGGTDISLGLASAAVGQIPKVKVVDSNGVPTEWEAANMASGADGKSAYQYAQDGGYTGTEAEFAERMAAEIPAVDSTLTQSGQAADAAVVGNALAELEAKEETDPTVPAWAKADTKPTYTADEVGALPADTVIPVVPDSLKNPYAITFTGGATGSYDGSSELSIAIPEAKTYKAGTGISISDDGTISVTAAKIYSGTSNAPSADLGENGDIYIQTEG